jgi:hypothetical protein
MHALMKQWLKTNRRVRKAHELIEKAREEIKKAQASCDHPGLRHQYGSNTGNYDPSSDSYWTDFYCNVCDMRWRAEGSIRAPNSTSTQHGEKLNYTILTEDRIKVLDVKD